MSRRWLIISSRICPRRARSCSGATCPERIARCTSCSSCCRVMGSPLTLATWSPPPPNSPTRDSTPNSAMVTTTAPMMILAPQLWERLRILCSMQASVTDCWLAVPAHYTVATRHGPLVKLHTWPDRQPIKKAIIEKSASPSDAPLVIATSNLRHGAGYATTVDSVDGILEGLARLERRHLGGADLDRLASLRVTAGTSSTLLNRKSTKADERHGIPLLEALGNALDHGIQRA